MKPLLPCLLLAAGAAHAQATFSLGPTVGANLTTQHSSASVNNVDINDLFTYRLDWLAGVQATARWGKFAVQPSLLFSQKGYKYSYVTDYRNAYNLPVGSATIRSSVQLSYLTLPVNAVFTPLGENGPQLFAGPYVSVLLSARDKHTDLAHLPTDDTVTEHLPVAETLDSSTGVRGLRRFDAGLQGGLGYRYQALQFQLSYSLGLRTTVPAYTFQGAPVSSAGNYNRGFQASLAYLFSGAK